MNTLRRFDGAPARTRGAPWLLAQSLRKERRKFFSLSTSSGWHSTRRSALASARSRDCKPSVLNGLEASRQKIKDFSIESQAGDENKNAAGGHKAAAVQTSARRRVTSRAMI